jgi:hypothetical protein
VRTLSLLAVSLLLLHASPRGSWAQEGAFAFQIRGGGFVPLGELRNAHEGWEGKAGADVGFGMGFTFPLRGRVGTYLGFTQYRFSCDEELCPEGEAWKATGFDLALRFVMGGDRRVRTWVQGGLHTHRLESLVFQGEETTEIASRAGGGIEVGGGVLIRVGERASLAPGLRYGLGTVPFRGHEDVRLRYLVADLGLVIGF